MLSSDTKALRIKAKHWVKIFLAIHTTIIILIIAELSTSKWVYLDSSNFKGGVIMCYDGCDKKQTYQDFYDDNCKSSNSYGYYESDSTDSFCELIDGLASSGKTKLILDIVSIVMIIGWSITMIFFKKSQKIRSLNLCFTLVSIIIFISGTATWLTNGSIDFEHCGTSDFTGSLSACVSHGPKLGIAIMVILFFTMVAYFIVASTLNSQFMQKELKKENGGHANAQIIVGPVQNVNFAQPVYPQPMPGQTMYPQPIYHQPMYPQPVYSQPVYAPSVVMQSVVADSSHPSYNSNIKDTTNLKRENNDETFVATNKD